MEYEQINQNRIRLLADLAVFENPKNCIRNESVFFRSGDCVCFDVILLNNANIADCSNIVSVSFEIMDIGDVNQALPRSCKTLFKRDIYQASINKQLTQDDITNGSAHFSIVMSSADSSISCGDRFLKICAYTDLGDRITFASGWITILPAFEGVLDENPQNAISLANHLQGLINKESVRIDLLSTTLSDTNSTIELFDAKKADKDEVFSKSEISMQLQNVNDCIDDNKNEITVIKENLKSAGMFKSNAGVLHWSGSTNLTCSKNQGLPNKNLQDGG